jgi:type I restriction enzyme M protein
LFSACLFVQKRNSPTMPDQSVFVDALTRLGGSAGNQKLQETLGWAADRYDAVKERLLQDGKIESGRGRGGSVKLVATATGTAPDLFDYAAKPKPVPEPVKETPAPAEKPERKQRETTGASLGFEAKLWLAADKLRNNMDAAEYKHVVLGLVFLKYISDSFEEMRNRLVEGKGEYAGANPEDPDEYRAENVFWVPKEARWPYLQENAKQPTIGKVVDDAMVAIERDNIRLKGVLPKDFARPGLDKHRLGELIDLIGTIGLGDRENRAKDILGRVYEYFLTQFASAEGKNGGQFYTPSCIVRTLVEMLAPYKGRIYDPCCGSGGMFVQSRSSSWLMAARLVILPSMGRNPMPPPGAWR